MTLNEFLTEIANAIRSKKGTTAQIKASNFASEIASIQVGEGGGGGLPSNFYSEGLEYWDDIDFFVCNGRGTCTDSIIVIPPTRSGKHVTEIGALAFALDDDLVGVVIPPSVNYIDDGAFSASYNLKRVDLSRHTEIPTLENVLGETFDGLTNPQTQQIKVPANLYAEWIEETNWCDLADFIVPLETEALIYELLDDGTYMVVNANDCADEEYIVIPSTYNGKPVTRIEEETFNVGYSFPSVIIGNNVKTIGMVAFGWCEYIEEIEMPPSVEYIDDEAFYDCGELKRVDFSKHTTIPYLGEDVFVGCHEDLQIKVPANLYNEWIEDTNWSDWADYIVTEWGEGEDEVYGSVGLEYDESGDECYVIGMGTCTDTELIIPSVYNGLDVTVISACAFMGKKITSVVIPDTIIKIEEDAFSSCESLTKVVFGSGLECFEGFGDIGIFEGCSKLQLLDFRNATRVPSLYVPLFDEFEETIPEDLQILVPSNLYDEWIEDTNWCVYADYIDC